MKRFFIRLAAIGIFVLSALYLCFNFYQGNFSVSCWGFIALLISFVLSFKPELIEHLPSMMTGKLNPQKEDKKIVSIPKNIVDDLLEDKRGYQRILKEMADIADEKEQNIKHLQGELKKCQEFSIKVFEDRLRYEFSYLSLFYVYNTKRVLAWIDYKGNVNIDELKRQALSFGVKEDNIRTTLTVLIRPYMIDVKDNVVYTTPRAKAFLQFIDFKYPELDAFINKLSKFLKGKQE